MEPEAGAEHGPRPRSPGAPGGSPGPLPHRRSARRAQRGTPRADLAGALVVVTGAGSGIGRATATKFANLGSTVIACDIDEAAARNTAEKCRGHAYEVDVSAWDQVEGLAKRIADEHGAPDVLVNNAGVGMSGHFVDVGVADWEWIVGINLMGVVHGCAAFAPAMSARGSGHIVNLASALGYFPRSTESAYCTTKAAVLMLSRTLRADLAGSGVGVSAICPGVINTPIARSTRFRGERASRYATASVRNVFERYGHDPGIVADAIVRALRRNLAVVPVGIEARTGWALSRLLPAALTDRAARTTWRGV